MEKWVTTLYSKEHAGYLLATRYIPTSLLLASGRRRRKGKESMEIRRKKKINVLACLAIIAGLTREYFVI